MMEPDSVFLPLGARLSRAEGNRQFLQTVARWRRAAKLPHGHLRELAGRLVFADLLLPVYLAGVVRQYFWGIQNLYIAWALTAAVSMGIWGLLVRHRDEKSKPLNPSFWVIVGLPLFLMYALRAPFPDFNFDVLNYHLVNTERALRGWPFSPGDFFPGILHVNPAPDIASGIYRYALGYRLGTLINLGAIIWTAQSVEMLLRNHISKDRWRYACVLLAVSTEHILYLLNLYMIDLLALPLLLGSIVLALSFENSRRKNSTIVQIALFLGVSICFKLTNLAFALPIGAVVILKALRFRRELRPAPLLLAALALVAPILPFSLYMYGQTGNPIFPYYNGLFRSPYVNPRNYKDPDHGPENLFQTLTWPIWGYIYPDRISAMNGALAYTGRLSLGFIVAGLGLASRTVKKDARVLCFLTFASAMLWSMSSGDIRYGLAVEITGGIAIVAVVSGLASSSVSAAATKYAPRAIILVLTIGGLLILQFITAYQDASMHHEYLFGQVVQPTIFEDPKGYLQEAREFLSDRSPERYIAQDDRRLLNDVGVWINSYDTTSGAELISNPSAPVLGVCPFLNLFDYMEMPATRARVSSMIESARSQRIFTLSNPAHIDDSLRFIHRAGLREASIRPVNIPFYSERISIPMRLIEVVPASGANGQPLSAGNRDSGVPASN